MRDIDRMMVDELGISLVRMMENAGRNLALVARFLLGGTRGASASPYSPDGAGTAAGGSSQHVTSSSRALMSRSASATRRDSWLR
jgi:hypothetical protein